MTTSQPSIGIHQLLEMQKQAFIQEGPVSAEVRVQRIQQVIDLLVENKDALCQAMGEDFGGRPAVFSLANDIIGSLSSLKHARPCQ